MYARKNGITMQEGYIRAQRIDVCACNLMSQYLIYTMQCNAAQWNAMKHSIL